MTVVDHPVLVPTSAGLVGAIVTEPSVPRAAAVLFAGIRQTRARGNGTWAILARALADQGIVAFRADYAGSGESRNLPDGTRVSDTAAEATAWFRERTAGLDLLVVGACFGIGPALELVDRDPAVRAAALLTPPAPPAPRETPPPSRARVLAHRVRYAPRHLSARVRDGRDPVGDYRMSGTTPLAARLAATVRRLPTLVLAGELDRCAPLVESLRDDAAAGPGSQALVLPGLALYRQTSAVSQQEERSHTVAFLTSHVTEGATA